VANVSKIRVDGDIAANGAQAYGKAGQIPLLLVNNVGKGQAILLNFDLASYTALAANTSPETVPEVIKALLNVANVKPALVLLDSKAMACAILKSPAGKTADRDYLDLPPCQNAGSRQDGF